MIHKVGAINLSIKRPEFPMAFRLKIAGYMNNSVNSFHSETNLSVLLQFLVSTFFAESGA